MKNKEKIFDDLYKRKYKMVAGYCKRYTNGDRHEAEDLAHEIFINAYKGLDKFNNKSTVDTWLFRIMKNIYIKMLLLLLHPSFPFHSSVLSFL